MTDKFIIRGKLMTKKVAVLNTKGGCGKSVISNFILPFYFAKSDENGIINENQNITLIEFEATNKSRESKYTNSIIKYINNNLVDKQETKKLISKFSIDEEACVIIDSGGGRDSLRVIGDFKEANGALEDFVFVLPFKLDDDSFDGAVDIYRRLLKEDDEAKVVFVVNEMKYPYDESGEPYKEFLSDEDVFEALSRAKINTDDILKNENVRLSYIPQMPELLPEALPLMEGCCLDMCFAFFNGESASMQRKKLKEATKKKKVPQEKKEEFYINGMQEIARKGDLYRILHYSKPFYKAIDSLGGNRYPDKEAENEK